MIAKNLLDGNGLKISQYLGKGNWNGVYHGKLKKIVHDEPWLTLIACYSLFGDQSSIGSHRLAAVNELFNSAGIKSKFSFTEITKVKVEEKMPEILEYRKYLKALMQKERLHYYSDRLKVIESKVKKKLASFEGNTNLDLMIEGISNGKKTTIFIEAKFLSDISCQISYNPVRDQIARNIDCGIDYVEKTDNTQVFEDFYFMLLTPKAFRTELFGKGNTALNNLGSDRSRLYCYKMNDYKEPEKLKKALPHRNLSEKDWNTLSANIGWIAFEDFALLSDKHGTVDDPQEADEIRAFFEERNLR